MGSTQERFEEWWAGVVSRSTDEFFRNNPDDWEVVRQGKQARDVYHTGYAAGAEDMRERAAKVCEHRSMRWMLHDNPGPATARQAAEAEKCRKAIRALPTEAHDDH